MKAKIFNWLSAIILTLTMSFYVVSCGLIDLDKEGDGLYEAGWTENGNTIIFKYELDLIIYKLSYVLEFTFSGDTCVSAVETVIFPDTTTAQAFYNELDDDEKAVARLNGKQVTLDISEDYKGLSKAELKASIDAYYGSLGQ